ncbi:hypothetical protein TcWFU_006250 [Taenia crassiceps]|uniref:Uncharacterized protein n=1 Tax=Taenia crassiceps TaxID=6207 RepID=A0ABR4Q753_9CEST
MVEYSREIAATCLFGCGGGDDVAVSLTPTHAIPCECGGTTQNVSFHPPGNLHVVIGYIVPLLSSPYSPYRLHSSRKQSRLELATAEDKKDRSFCGPCCSVAEGVDVIGLKVVPVCVVWKSCLVVCPPLTEHSDRAFASSSGSKEGKMKKQRRDERKQEL